MPKSFKNKTDYVKKHSKYNTKIIITKQHGRVQAKHINFINNDV